MPANCSKPPRLPDRFLQWFCAEGVLETLQGDLYELYEKRKIKRGKMLADVMYWADVVSGCRPFAFGKRKTNNVSSLIFTYMIRNYFVLVLRIAARNRLVTSFNILGLSAGITAFILIALYAEKELSYDRFHHQPENIFRIVSTFSSDTERFINAQTAAALAPVFRTELPEIEAAARLFRYRSDVVVENKATASTFTEANFFWADTEISDVFEVQMKSGSATVLSKPNAVIISASMARKYFGIDDPLGRRLENPTFGTAFTVEGVFADFPANSHFRPDFLCSLVTLRNLWGEGIMSSWGNSFLYSYVRISGAEKAAGLETRMNSLMKEKLQLPPGIEMGVSLQPLTSIHLYSQLTNELEVNSSATYLYILTSVGFLILAVSCVNFVNLGIARSQRRSKEIGVRKVMGSSSRLILWQVVFENSIYGLGAFVVSLFVIKLGLPKINEALDEHLVLSLPESIWPLAAGFAAILMVITITSIYPSMFISRLRTAEALKGRAISIGKGFGVWQGLVMFQVGVAVFLIAACLFLNKQLRFLRSAPLGYEVQKVVNIPLLSDRAQQQYLLFKTRLLQNPLIESASASSHLIGGRLYQSQYEIYRPGQDPAAFTWQRFHADHDFLKTNELNLVAGRDFSRDFPTDSLNFIINRTAAKALGYAIPEEAIGIEIRGEEGRGQIVGVIDDFHFKSLHHVVEPLVIHIEPSRFRFLSVRFSDAASPEPVISLLRDEWADFEANDPFVYAFPSVFTGKVYAFEEKLRRLIISFTIVAFILSLAGVAGLSYYIIRQKEKEIGIRRVLGAAEVDILVLVARGFLVLVASACILALPVSWLLIEKWLDGFAYRVTMETGIFGVAGAATAAVCLMFVAVPSLKAALKRPVDALRDE